MSIQINRTDPLYKQLMDSIVSQIRLKKLRPHDQISSVRGLAAEYGVSTITVRRCINELVAEGVLYSRQGKGTFVAEKSTDTSGEYKTRLEHAAVIGYQMKEVNSPASYEQMGLGIQEAADQAGIKLAWSEMRDVIRNGGIAAFLNREGIQGVLLFGITNEEYIRQTAKTAPTVVLDFWMADENIDYITVDNVAGAFQLTKHLIESGHKRISYIGMKRRDKLTNEAKADPDSHERLAGCRMALEEAGLSLKENYIFPNLEGEEKTVKEILSLKELPTALFVFTRSSAFRIMELLEEHGISVPRDMSIVTFSGDPACLSGSYPLTCIYMDLRHMGRLALRRLSERVENDTPYSVKLAVPGVFVKGGSTAPQS